MTGAEPTEAMYARAKEIADNVRERWQDKGDIWNLRQIIETVIAEALAAGVPTRAEAAASPPPPAPTAGMTERARAYIEKIYPERLWPFLTQQGVAKLVADFARKIEAEKDAEIARLQHAVDDMTETKPGRPQP